MRHLVVVRHGKYNFRNQDNDHAHITADGQSTMEALAVTLSRFFGRDGLKIISSPLTYACDSTYIIGIKFRVGHSTEDKLRMIPDYWPDEINGVVELIEGFKNSGVETLILVTHFEYATHLIPLLLKRWFGKEMHAPEIDYAHGTILECETGDIHFVP